MNNTAHAIDDSIKYATYTTTNGVKTGFVHHINNKTIIVKQITFTEGSYIRKHMNLTPFTISDDLLKIHIKKHNVKLYPSHIIPINR